MAERVQAGPGRALSRAEVREVDRRAIEELGVPGALLMENAGLGLTRAVVRELEARGARPGAAVCIVCGQGNNGGDGFVLARHLDLQGWRPRVAYCGERRSARRDSDAGLNLGIVEAAQLTLVDTPTPAALRAQLAAWSDAPLVVDALFGTGLASDLREPARFLVATLDADPRPKVAVDIPSGLDCDRGVPLGACVRAELTVSFVAPKLGFAAPGAADYTGRVEVVGIGCPRQAWSHCQG